MISSTAKSSLAAMNRSLRLYAPSHTRISTIKHKPQCPSLSLGAPAHRQLSESIRFAYPRKDSQDKDSINTEATEYSKSGTDDEGARQEDAAFNPDITDPQQTKDVAGEGTEGTDKNNPLDVSPANPEVSKQRDETEGGPENSSGSSNITGDRQRTSGGGGPPKGTKVV